MNIKEQTAFMDKLIERSDVVSGRQLSENVSQDIKDEGSNKIR